MGEVKENVPSNMNSVEKISCDKTNDHSKKNCSSKKLNLSSIKLLTHAPSAQVENFVGHNDQYSEQFNLLKTTHFKHEQSKIINHNPVQIGNNIEGTQAFSTQTSKICLKKGKCVCSK